MTAILLCGRFTNPVAGWSFSWPAVRASDSLCGGFTNPVAGWGAVRCMDIAKVGREELVRQVADDLADHEAVLALVPDWASAETWRVLGMARYALETTRLVSLHVSLPPLALAVFAAQLGAVAERLPRPGHLVSGASWLARRLVVAAWSSRATGRRARNSGWSRTRLLSRAPRTRFAVTVQPMLGTRWLPASPDVLEPWRIDEPALLVVAGLERDRGWVREVARPALEPAVVVETGPLPDARRWWGARHVVEIVSCPADADEPARGLAMEFPWRACDWCGEEVFERICPFCRMVGRHDLSLEVMSS